MKLSRISTIIIVLLVLLACVFCQVKGDTNLLSDDKDFTSGSGDIDTIGQYQLIAIYTSFTFY